MDILIIASLIIGAVILFLVELFVIPGISVAGFLAGGCIIFANYYAFAYMGTTAGVITLIISALALYRLVGMVHALQDTRQNCIEKTSPPK